ncbi:MULTISPECIES: hypothetical protein [Streptomyces]|uniref:Uncharacterized protein n=1 Tax=Streptomyces tsukubensis (strain DSM 42081 / NBRC 108919 / NRRL 18488 / 9993) TaxID=1114943 RepID=A0A7G3UHN7_STRT9|nr:MULTISPECIES: hypothetical protein [Streptomyces]MYS62948.1 hypothetical protein [Streptomyces sp. SID5473]QKM68640.1 hypothetical protein STSU_017125 [Streptomyces tsukubensis NRRL18488]TAI43448.1 hypothetical protein EWI31_16885 [Streptomyces tsukubensis]
MAVTRLVGECEKGTCATLYRVEGSGDLLVQGYDVENAGAVVGTDIPVGETVVRIPAEIIERYVREHLVR